MKYFYIIIWFLFLKINVFASDLNSKMISVLSKNNKIWISGDNTQGLDQVFIYVKDFIFNILWIIWVWVFLYFWFKIISARWNPEEFKKTLMWFVYAIVWLAIIPFAYGLVKLVSSLNF